MSYSLANAKYHQTLPWPVFSWNCFSNIH